MWEIFNKLFGWQYVGYMYGGTTSIGRVKTAPNGRILVHLCCAGFIPISDINIVMWALTMTDCELKEMIETKDKG